MGNPRSYHLLKKVKISFGPPEVPNKTPKEKKKQKQKTKNETHHWVTSSYVQGQKKKWH